MPTTGVLNGRLMRLTIAGEKLIHETECSIDISVEVRDTASKDIPEGWADGETGQKSWSSSISGLFSYDDAISAEARADAEAFFDAVSAGSKVAVEFLTGVSGDIKFTGSAIVTALNFSFPNNENATYSVTLQGAGPMLKATIA